MQYQPLHAHQFATIHTAFLDAFSDYAVPFQISKSDLAEMLRRRGWMPEASVGVFDGERLVAFTLNGVGTWNGRTTGYDTGTGVVPSHRGLGLSRGMIDASADLLRQHGAVQYLLEVLQSNERASRLYRTAGFEVTRELQCWSVERQAAAAPDVAALDDVNWDLVTTFFDVAPSWQNSIASIRRASAARTILGVRDGDRLTGCAVVFENGDVPFVAVARDARRRGIGTALLQTAAAQRPLRLINVDTTLASAAPFLEKNGAVKTVSQFEMMKVL